MYTVQCPELVGCAANLHSPDACSGCRKSAKPGGTPCTTSQLKPSSGSNNWRAGAGSSCNLTSLPSALASSSATFSAARAACSSRGGDATCSPGSAANKKNDIC